MVCKVRNYFLIAIILAHGTLPFHFGCIPCASSVHGVPRGGSRHLSPDAVTNVVHGYAHINDKKETEEIVPVKSSTTKKATEKDDDWEDPFFHAVLHNNDRSSGVVKNVVSKKESDERVDEEMFVKFSKKVFHYPRSGEKKKDTDENEEHEKITYGLREFIQDSSMME